jgi:ABC-type multidrug transport system permease subunit
MKVTIIYIVFSFGCFFCGYFAYSEKILYFSLVLIPTCISSYLLGRYIGKLENTIKEQAELIKNLFQNRG